MAFHLRTVESFSILNSDYVTAASDCVFFKFFSSSDLNKEATSALHQVFAQTDDTVEFCFSKMDRKLLRREIVKSFKIFDSPEDSPVASRVVISFAFNRRVNFFS